MIKVTCIFILITHFVSAQFEGDSCTSYGANGVCKNINDCPEVIQALQETGIFPVNCGYIESIPIVCCVKKGADTTTKKPTTRTTRRTTTTPRFRPTGTTTAKPVKRPDDYAVGKLSIEKCEEYGKYVFEMLPPPVFIPGESLVNVSHCGFKAVGLIVGGTKTTPLEFPHQALLGFEEDGKPSWQCGGSLISDKFVLSAAHCASSDLGPVKYVRLGELDYGESKENGEGLQDFIISQIIKHPEWKPPKQYNDIMLLRLDKTVKFDRFIRPVCLHTTYKIESNSEQSADPRFIATGWGRIEYGGDISTHLLKVVLDSFAYQQCADTYKSVTKRRLPNGIVDKSQLCAGGKNEDKDTCQGDSGGPLQVYSTKVYCMYELVGVTSFGKTCGVQQVPGVYTRVSEYIDWIEKTVWKS